MNGSHRASKAKTTRFRKELRATSISARVTRLALDADDLRDELDDEALVAAITDNATRGLATKTFAMAILRAEERERVVTLLHLVAKLDLEPPTAHCAGLAHSGHDQRVS
jgi:hypothetical protein